MKRQPGHTSGTPVPNPRTNCGDPGVALAHEAASTMGPVAQILPRLLDLHAAAKYLSLSVWTIRGLEHAGFLPRIRVPASPGAQCRPRNGKHNNGGGETRRLLFDRVDLDQAVERWKERIAP